MKSRSRASRSLFVAAKKCTIATGAEVSTAQHQINEQLIIFKLSQFPKVLSLGAASIVEILITKAITLTVCLFVFDPVPDWIKNHVFELLPNHFTCNRRKKSSRLESKL